MKNTKRNITRSRSIKTKGRASKAVFINLTDYPYKLGKNYFISTVTKYYTGKLMSVTDKELVLTNAAWVADTGRFSEAMAKETFSEVEKYPAHKMVIVGRGALVDAVEISALP